MHAVIKSGSHQYLVAENDVVKLQKLPHKVGDKIKFDEVLLTFDGKKTNLGTPTLDQATVEAEVTDQARHAKVWGVKMKAKKRNRKLFGHKQPYTAVKITKISA